MLGTFLLAAIVLAAQAASLGVALAAGRRFWLSRGGNTALYGTIAALAAADAAVMLGLDLFGHRAPPPALFLSLALFGAWLCVREVTRRIDPADPPPRFEPVFTTARRAPASPLP